MKFIKNNMMIKVVFNLPAGTVTVLPESIEEVDNATAEEIRKRLSIFDVEILNEAPVPVGIGSTSTKVEPTLSSIGTEDQVKEIVEKSVITPTDVIPEDTIPEMESVNKQIKRKKI